MGWGDPWGRMGWGLLDSGFPHRPPTQPAQKDPGVPVTPCPAAVTTMWGFVARRVPGDAPALHGPREGWLSPAGPRMEPVLPGQGRSRGFVEVLISGGPAARAGTAPRPLLRVPLQYVVYLLP